MDGPHGRSGSRPSRALRTVKTRAKSPFEVLGLDPRSSTKQEARQRYRELMKRYHPDVASETGAEERATEINLAYEAVLRGWEDLGGEASGEADGPLDSTAPGDPIVSWYNPFDQEQYWV